MFLPEIECKLKNQGFATIFLDYNGLDLFEHILDFLPDGSLPTSHLRKRVLTVLSTLPIETHNIENSRIENVLHNLRMSNLEMRENIELIKEIEKKMDDVRCIGRSNFTNHARDGERYRDDLELAGPSKFTKNVDEDYYTDIFRANRRRHTYGFVKRPQSEVIVKKGSSKHDVS